MAKRMLIDATHPEETRVVVVKGTRLEEFDFETSTKLPLKGNIYLAKVVRVEPSLQAAFVEYGGNRHGFLAFSEIHPDYYQIPIADRQALLARQAAEDAAAEEPEPEAPAEDLPAPAEDTAPAAEPREDEAQAETFPAAPAVSWSLPEAVATPILQGPAPDEFSATGPASGEVSEADAETLTVESGTAASGTAEAGASLPPPEAEFSHVESLGHVESLESEGAAEVTSLGGGDDLDEVAPRRSHAPYRAYKIQEVIKRRQILLIQVVKEERGNKGAALTTFISLAGRYCVLMPNTARGGGISRKIVSAADRKRLKEIVSDLDVPTGMGVILRTAGLDRSKAEIKRDFEYLVRLWDSVRDLTLRSSAPCLVYEEGSLIKRAIRDYYSNEIEEILIEGEEAYRVAKDFMRMLMPSHAKRVQPYRDRVHLFHRYQVEQQFDQMYSPTVQLRSGGYIVINPTEALVSIDVNSGKSTREHNIEETAYKTNLEAAEEVARQLRLRDLAGLIVIDFIDMEDPRNNRAVERRLKDSLKSDRARIQLGRISAFGLMEMSRQRLRPSLLESSTEICRHCQGRGYLRSTESTALHILRAIEDEGIRDRSSEILVHVATSVALYLLNQKRASIQDIESRYGMRVLFESDDSLVPPNHRIERRATRAPSAEGARVAHVHIHTESVVPADLEEEAEEQSESTPDNAEAAEAVPVRNEDGTSEPRRRRRRRRRRGAEEAMPRVAADPDALGQGTPGQDPGSERDFAPSSWADADQPEVGGEDGGGEAGARPAQAQGSEESEERRRRRRGRRGGRRRRREDEARSEGSAAVTGGDMAALEPGAAFADPMPESGPTEAEPTLAAALEDQVADEAADDKESPAADAAPGREGAPRRAPRRRRSPAAADIPVDPVPLPETPPSAETASAETESAFLAEPEPARPAPTLPAVDPAPPAAPPRRGWWRR